MTDAPRVRARWAVLPAGLALGVLGAPLAAQCRPGSSSNEARLLAFYSTPIAFSPAVTPAAPRVGAVDIGAEVVPVPSPDPAIERTGACFTEKTERTRLAPLFARPRIAIALPAALRFEVSVVPPITVWDAEPLLASAALSRPQRLGTVARWRALATPRVHGTIGRVRGPITCPAQALQQDDPSGPCYGRTPSRDTFRPDMVGADVTVAMWSPAGRIALYAGGGATWLRPRFRVNFADANGFVDRTRVEVNLTRGVVFGGLTARVAARAMVGVEVYAAPADATIVRLAAQYRLREGVGPR